MSLSVGDRLGPYEILAPIGAGGMGEVYKARDTRLDRVVAVKVSKDEFTERFTREARSIAALNHSNICHLYDVGPNYLVMEYVEGEALKGPLPLDEAMPIIQQLIDGIEAAHERNVVHRDLKPANIKITPDGVVKILDFGLARAADPATESSAENSPTLTMNATQAGTILGTAAYMSPEQAKGKTADRRSDIWSFGAVVYELLTGKRPFEGETVVETLGAVLNKEPDWTPVPTRMRRLLQRCLKKDRKQRLAAISDACWMMEEAPQAAALSIAPPPSRSGKLGRIAAGIVVIIAASTSFIAYRATRPAPLKPLVRLDVDLGSSLAGATNGARVILSPDGTRLVYVSNGKLFIRKLDQATGVELPGTQGAFAPFFSPDSQWVAFFTTGKLMKISAEGGAAIALCDTIESRGGSWGEDGNIITTLATDAPLYKVPAAGGTPTPATQLVPGEIGHRWPQVLPGGKAVLFTATLGGGPDVANIEVMTLADRRRKTIVRGGTFGRYLATSGKFGHLVYVNRGTLFALPFDLEKLEAHGTPVPVLEQVAYATTGAAQVAYSENGTLVYRSGSSVGRGLLTVQWLDAAGKMQPLLAKPGVYTVPRISPDGTRLALVMSDASGQDIWVYDWKRDTMTRATFGARVGNNIVWSPDGRYLVYFGAGGIFWTRADGSGKPQMLIQSKDVLRPRSFAPDGKRLAYDHESPGSSAEDIWTMAIENNGSNLQPGKPEPFLQTAADERQEAFSPDGRWLAYASNESGVYQVYVRAFPDKGGKWQISGDGGLYPLWSRNTRNLFFRSQDSGKIMIVNYTTKDDSFVADKPRVWSEKPIGVSTNGDALVANYDLSPDGERIAALMSVDTPEGSQAQTHITFLMNFFDELRRRVPVNK